MTYKRESTTLGLNIGKSEIQVNLYTVQVVMA